MGRAKKEFKAFNERRSMKASLFNMEFDRSQPVWVGGVLLLFLLLSSSFAQQPGSLKTLRPSDPVSDASGTGQLFENIHVPGITDNVEGTNGFALADLDSNGYLDYVAVTTPPFDLEGYPPRDSVCDNMVNFNYKPDSLAFDKLRVLLNKGGWVFEERSVTINGSPATASDLSQGWRGAQVPALVDLNKDGRHDLFIGRQPEMMSQGQIPAGTSPVGSSLFLAGDSIGHFQDVSQELNALNALAYNRQISIADVDRDGWLDIAIGADNIAAAFEGLPKSALYIYQPSGNAYTDGTYQDVGGTSTVPDLGGFALDPAIDRACPNLMLRDVDRDGDMDIVQGCHSLSAEAPSSHPYSPAEYRQGVFTWKNQLEESGNFGYTKDTLNGMAQSARMEYDSTSGTLVRMDPTDSAVGLSYTFSGDVDNDGKMDVLAIDGSDKDRQPHPIQDVGARFWYGQGGFAWTEATSSAGLSGLNDDYSELYNFFQDSITLSLYFKPDTVPAQPGLDPPRFAHRRPYHSDAAFADFNNDGWLDLVVLDRRQRDRVVTPRAQLYMNDGDGTFTRKTTVFSGLDATGISCEAADLNNDGLMDLIVSGDPDNSGLACWAQNYENKVYMNSGLHGAASNHYLRFRFEGISHAELIGARVELFDPSNGSLVGMRHIHMDPSYKSTAPLQAHFGLGNRSCADLKVTFPDGSSFSRSCVQADQFLTIDPQEDTLQAVSTKERRSRTFDEKVEVFPNPGPGSFQVSLRSGRSGRYRVLSQRGAVLQEGRFQGGRFTLELRDRSPGIYFLKLRSSEGALRTQKLIVDD
jgi:hypothetical protein